MEIIELLDTDKVEMFNGMLRFNPYLMFIDLILIFSLLYNWYKYNKVDKLKINYWYLFIFKYFFFNLLIMYPFNSSYHNRYSVGHLVVAIDKFVDTAFCISIIGYFSFLIGGYFYRKVLMKRVVNKDFFSFELFVQNNINSSITTYLMYSISLFLILIVLYFSTSNGFMFNPRYYFLSNSDVRPFYNLTLALFPISVIFIGLRCINFPSKINITLLLIILFFSMFLGTRAAILEPILILLFLFYLKKSENVNYFHVIGIVFFLLFLAITISNLRGKGASEGAAFQEIFFGNHFSDTRDFAWILTFFDFESWLGNTYFSGIITFIPRKFSEFREEWAWGVYSSKLIGVSDPTFPGLRPGFFGEMYFNFGIIGVILLGFISGNLVNHMNLRILNEYNTSRDVIKMYSYTILSFLVMSSALSIVFVSFYSYFGIMIVLTFVRQLIDFFKTKLKININ